MNEAVKQVFPFVLGMIGFGLAMFSLGMAAHKLIAERHERSDSPCEGDKKKQ